MKEVWKDVAGFEGLYEVSDCGNVRRNGKVLKPLKRNHGYLSVFLYDGKGGYKQVSIHRLVASAFVDNPFDYKEVNHLDEDKTNNNASNLQWCSHKMNSSYGTRGNRIANSNRNGKKSRKIAQYTLDGELVRIFPSLQEAARHGYAGSNISRCANNHPHYSHAYGFIWRYVS